ncbi:zinc finger C3H1 domain-containing protein isoform X2 [Festucalex cinctus]
MRLERTKLVSEQDERLKVAQNGLDEVKTSTANSPPAPWVSVAMNSESAPAVPTDDVELEDGEICDDDGGEEKAAAAAAAAQRGEGSDNRPSRAPRPPYANHPPPDFRNVMAFDVHGAPKHRQQCGPSGPDRPHASGPRPRPLPGPGPGPGIAPMCGGPGPRPSFWERSHGALGRFRHRSFPNRGGRGAWHRGGWAGHRPPVARYGPGPAENSGSPGRKQKPPGRNPARRAPLGLAKSDGAESFEDLLAKYKQIQLELECIRKEEAKVQGAGAKGQEAEPEVQRASAECPAQAVAPAQASARVPAEDKKSFQAFNIKPLRAKLVTLASLDAGGEEEEKDAARADAEAASKAKVEVCCHDDANDDDDGKTPGRESSASSDDVFICLDELGGQVEEDDLSELQLRLLALQSASRKWQQQEQQVMKRSREPAGGGTGSKTRERQRDKSKPGSRERPRTPANAKPAPVARTPSDRSGPKKSGGSGERPRRAGARARASVRHAGACGLVASAGKQALRKRQLRTWKLQRQRDQDERHKREDEIRRIRDLSNQDEQYKRFMKLVGGKTHAGAKVRDGDGRRSGGRTGPDAAGNLYQYDNYEQVAMETDSEPGSPGKGDGGPPVIVSRSSVDLGAAVKCVLCVCCCSARAALPSEGSSAVPVPALHLTASAACAPPLPPPPPALPPKPPFADEEEEEEMLLRETCLMSMASKRVGAAAEEPPWSAPPSPTPPPAPEQPGRGNLSAVSLNTMTTLRGNNKFARGAAARAPLVLPRHKSVVVSLNVSDDSDSDSDLDAAAQGMFGGLEFMIKEARRTAEVNAGKSKGAAATSEKENNPVRTPEALPEAKKAEYRFLRDELAREQQKVSNHDARSASAANPAAASLVSQAEQKLRKQRELLVRDEALLKNLLQQQLKKSESLKAAESKVARLREQMQAADKMVLANKTLLKKIQEQVRRVEHRVFIKKSLAARLEQELLWTQTAAGREPKRKAGAVHKPARKLQRVDAAKHFAALMAQKQRLQQLESEYALKIQKLKEAQASRNKAAPSEAAGERRRRRPKPAAAAALPQPKVCPPGPPQPSLHDLTQDILVLDSETDADEPEEAESTEAPRQGSARPRRCSFRRSSSTKPNLEQPASAPAPKGAKPAESAVDAAGLDLEALRSRQRRRPGPGDVLLEELSALGQLTGAEEPEWRRRKSVTALPADASQAEEEPARPLPFGPYRSPLLAFKSYRFSPYYRTKEKLSLSSATFSNAIRPKRRFCRFDLTGTCNDDDCSWQHVRSCTLAPSLLFQDVLSYNLSLIGCSDSSSDSQIGAAAETYVSKLFGARKDGMSADQKAVFLLSQVNESRRHVPPFTTWKDKRKWRPSAPGQRLAERAGEEDAAEEERTCAAADGDAGRPDALVTSEDKRYFVSDTDDIGKLESGVLEKPADTQLWIKLAFRYLRQGDTPSSECLEAALNTLSRALENNCEDPEVWTHYLTLFARRGRRDEVEEMCQMAVEHAPHRRVWWNYLSLSATFEAKDSVCERLVNFLLACEDASSSEEGEELSFQLLEALVYRVHLNVFAGRPDAALALFQAALEGVAGRRLRVGHRALAWLWWIHLKEFGRLPSVLSDASESGPARLAGAQRFLLPWRSAADVATPHQQLLRLFADAIGRCSDQSLAPRQRTLACLPLHVNLLLLHELSDRFSEGVSLCEALLEACPDSCVLRDVLCRLHVRSGNAEGAVDAWLRALARRPHDARLFYHCCRFLMDQDKSSAVTPLLAGFVRSLCEERCAHLPPVHILRSVLGLPSDDVRPSAVLRKEAEDDVLLQQRCFLHLLHCRWHWLHGSAEAALDAFERALGSAAAGEQLQRVWSDYLQFCGERAARRLPDLVLRCLGTVPARLQLPFDPTHFWTSYRFHNKVVSLYLSWVEPSQQAALLERLHYMMPANVALALRLMQHEWEEGNVEHVRFQARMLTNSAPKCLPAWNVAIAVEAELRQPAEARRLVQQALQNLPLCAQLWKHVNHTHARLQANRKRLTPPSFLVPAPSLRSCCSGKRAWAAPARPSAWAARCLAPERWAWL